MSLNILIVDDSPIIRAVLVKTLEMAKVPVAQCHQAGNGQEALEVMTAQPVDLMFLDINMPVMTGVELVEKMNADGSINNVDVVVISTEGSTTRVEQLKAKGIRGYLRKPFTPEQLKAIVDTLPGASHAA